MKTTAPIIQFRRSALMSLFVFALLLNAKVIGQTQAPSVQTGVTFQWDDIQTGPNDPATISSITIDGVVYRSFASPSTYEMTRLGPDGHSPNNITRNGVNVNNSSANAGWAVDALAAFQDKNLNHYFYANPNGRDICSDFSAIAATDSQLQTFEYNPGIPSNDGGLIAITERNANNCYYISVYGTPVGGGPEQFLGDTFVRENTTQWGALFNAPPAGVDYWNAGRIIENGGTIGIAIFKLDDLAPVGSIITKFELLAATRDHGDGKAFIIQKYAQAKGETGCLNEEFNGTVDGTTNIPVGSTFSLVSGPVPAGQAFTFNSDGSYSYTPDPGFLGDVVFDYEVCLPAPNASTCDSDTVTITFVSYAAGICKCISGNSDGPLLQTN